MGIVCGTTGAMACGAERVIACGTEGPFFLFFFLLHFLRDRGGYGIWDRGP